MAQTTDKNVSSDSKLAARLKQMEATERELANKYPAPSLSSYMANGIRKKVEKEWAKITREVLIEMDRPRRSKDAEAQHQKLKAARAERRKAKRLAAKAA